MPQFVDCTVLDELYSSLTSSFGRGEFYTFVENKKANDQLIARLDRAAKIACEDPSLHEYQFDTEIQKISTSAEKTHAELLRVAKVLSTISFQYYQTERALIERLDGPPNVQATSQAGAEEEGSSDPFFDFEEGHASGILALNPDLITLERYNSGGWHFKFNFVFLDAGGVFTIGRKDNEIRIPFNVIIGQAAFELGKPQDDEYASRQKQTGKDGKYNDHGGFAGGGFSWTGCGGRIGLGHGDKKGSTDVFVEGGMGYGNSAYITQHEERDPSGLTGTRHTEMVLPVWLNKANFGVKSSEKLNVIDLGI